MCIMVNAPFTFTTAWKVIKGWIKEDTRAKIKILGKNFYNELKQYIDEENIPDFLGGKCTKPLEGQHGPWNAFEIVEGSNPDDIVGIRRTGDPTAKVFTP